MHRIFLILTAFNYLVQNIMKRIRKMKYFARYMLNFLQVCCLNTSRTSPSDTVMWAGAFLKPWRTFFYLLFLCEKQQKKNILPIKCRKSAHSNSVWNILTNRRPNFVFKLFVYLKYLVVWGNFRLTVRI